MVRRALWERKRNRRLLADGGNGGHAGVERWQRKRQRIQRLRRKVGGKARGGGEARARLGQRVRRRTDEELEGYVHVWLGAEVAGWRVDVIRQEALARGAVGAAHVVGGPLVDAAADLGRAG